MSNTLSLLLLLSLSCCILVVVQAQSFTRTRSSLDFGWKFLLIPQISICNSSDPFPIKVIDQQYYGLTQVLDANTTQECEQACCQNLGCNIYQWCRNSSCGPLNSCWIGTNEGGYAANAGWISAQTSEPTTLTSCTVPQCSVQFNDSDWRTVNLPHDFVVENTFNPNAQSSHGYLPTGMGWYRLHFTLPSSAKGASIWVQFDGVYRNSVTFINGNFLGNHQSGYTSFIYDLPNALLNFGGADNVLAVYADATKFEGWWYEGGGIYRHVWLNIADPLHIQPWGVYAPSEITGQITNVGLGQFATQAVVYFDTDIINTRSTIQHFVLVSSVSDSTGTLLGSTTSNVTIYPNETTQISQSANIENVNLWSAEAPNLYNVTTAIVIAGTTIDSVVTTIGIRKVVFDVDQGLFVNNNPVKIHGVCNHQDFAGLGTALPDRVNLFRVQKLKEMGVNGWRMSHNPPNPELLDFTDSLGIMVMDENRNFANVSQYYIDAQDLVLRDRNHPSVIMWSLCNENGCMEDDPNGAIVGANFKTAMKSVDPTRPIVAAMNEYWGIGLSLVLDVQGINYDYAEYPIYHDSQDYQPIFASETASCMCARSIYITNETACHLPIYDADGCAQQWLQAVEEAPYVAGGFAWTGFDYKGEPYPFLWPDINSNFGTIDIAGFPKDTFYYYQSWYTNETVLHAYPHWNWEVGDNVTVIVYSNADYVEILIDGDSQGIQEIPYLGRANWTVTFPAPGVLQARAYSHKTIVATQDIATTGDPYSIGLDVETDDVIAADGQDVALVTVSILDSNGLLVPTANNYVNFTISSNGVILGVGNGDPSCLEPDKATGRSAFGGLARVVVQSVRGAQGVITLVAEAHGLAPGKVAISAQ